MNLRQAAQQALEALEWVWGGEPLTGKELDAITALRAALAEPEQEPVAWMQEMPVSGNEERSVRMTTVKMVADEWGNPIPLYTAPTPHKPDDDEVEQLRALNTELVEALRHCMKVMQDEADAYLAWNNDTNATLLAEIAALKEYLNDKE